jgi:dihydrofolate synthase/folylpolyglutamate synthase
VNYPESVQFLYALGNEVKTMKLGLERIQALLEALDHPERHGRMTHVTGTNGKGSTCAMIEAGLRAAGRTTGLYTSPHLVSPTERIRIQGEPVSEQDFARAFDIVHTVAESMSARGELDCHPTYFETVTAMAFVLFREANVDDVVLEVGLGGRLDATNVVRPALSVITPIDMDHMAYLGDTLDAIAGEKAGILKPGVPAIVSPQHPEALRRIEAEAALRGSPLLAAGSWPLSHLAIDAYGSRFLAGGHPITCPLPGEHQVDNARTAALALHTLGVPLDGIAHARWPGRLEFIRRDPDYLLDGAHNPAGAAALARYLRRFHSHRKITLIFAVMRDKPVEQMTSELFPLASDLIFTAPEIGRALPPEEIPGRGRVCPTVEDALAAIHDPDLVVITGSLFLVGAARALLANPLY